MSIEAVRSIFDCDMLALGDLTELWEWKIPFAAAGMYAGRMASKADVILWQCDRVPRWIREDYVGRHAEVRAAGAQLLRNCRLPGNWDHVDDLHKDTKILHFSKMSLQFWKPYKTRFAYDKVHPDPAAVALFWKYAGGVTA